MGDAFDSEVIALCGTAIEDERMGFGEAERIKDALSGFLKLTVCLTAKSMR
jgi:hypothetical protein